MTGVDIELLDNEQLMSDEGELIYRQATQHMFDDGKLATTAFGPVTADRDMPSYSRSNFVDAQEARDWHTQNAKSPSLGVWGVTVGEAIESGRHVVDDSESPREEGQMRAPGHCFIDFRGLSKPQTRVLRTKLYFHATARGEIATIAMLEDGQLFA